MMNPTDALLHVTGLKTHFTTNDGVVRAVDGVDLAVPRGTTVCVVGESGCGKSVTARSILQLVDSPGKIVDGSILWCPTDAESVDLASLDPRGKEMRKIRGGDISMIFQEPIASLSPMYPVGNQLVEAIRIHTDMDDRQAREHAVAMLKRVGIPQPELRVNSYSFELSGGMCQRVMIAIALACNPGLLIADEPTTALDVTTQARILDLIRELQAEYGMSVLFITHDLGVVAEIADEVIVMYLGTIVERGTVKEVFASPKHPYTRALLGSIPAAGAGRGQRLTTIRGNVPHPSQRPEGCPFHPRCTHAVAGLCDTADPPLITLDGDRQVRCVLYEEGRDAGERPDAEGRPLLQVVEPASEVQEAKSAHPPGEVLLDVRGLNKSFAIRKGRGMLSRVAGHVRAVQDVSFTIRVGETLGLVGESGCGKTTLGRCLIRTHTPDSGEIRYRTAEGEQIDAARLSRRELRPYQREARIIFQDPFSSLNPRMTLLQIIGDPLRNYKIAAGSELEDRVADMLRKVGLAPEYMRRYPHAFSGGERQRVNIARALIVGPRLVVADEPVSALDVSVRAQILNLLSDLKEQLGLTYLFISHDLSVVESICDRVAVMYLGKIVETADTAGLYTNPQHPYTEALFSAVPKPDPLLRYAARRIRLADDLPDPSNPPPGCAFHTRCSYARADICADASRVPQLREMTTGHLAACHLSEELTLTGMAGEKSLVER